jgi:hypothetical protein
MNRVHRAVWWTLPSLLCLALYWYGLKCWFAQDDFAWLSLHLDVQDLNGLWRNLFTPMAQGTIRFLSERGFFLLFYWLFGMDALPYRIFVFATQVANLVLLASIARRLTGSRFAGFAAPVLWMANSALATPMAWSSSYNQILCAFFLLLSFHFFLRHIETGRWSYYWWQWAAFLAGFGALELNVVYPALAFSYALLCARRQMLKTLPMFGASILYAALHRYAAPSATGVYAMHWDRSILQTLRIYTEWTMGTTRLDVVGFQQMELATFAAWVLIAALAAFVAWKFYRREFLALFFVSWYVLVLSPLLPLRDHMTTYYVTIPAIGLSMLAAWALAEASRSAVWIRIFSFGLAAIYLAAAIPLARAEVRWHYDRSHAVRDLTLGAQRAREIHPRQALVISGVSNDVFWATFPDGAFRTVGVENIYVSPVAYQRQRIEEHPEIQDITEFFLPSAILLRALDRGDAVVYDASGGRLRNITTQYSFVLEASKVEEPRFLDVGNPLFSKQLGTGWYSPDGTIRWMGPRAEVRLGGPVAAGQSLHLLGHAPQELFQNGTVRLTVDINSRELANFQLGPDNVDFELAMPLPNDLKGTGAISLVLGVSRTWSAQGDGRTISLAFGKIFIR